VPGDVDVDVDDAGRDVEARDVDSPHCLRGRKVRCDGRELTALDGDVAHRVYLILPVNDVPALEEKIVVGLSEDHARTNSSKRICIPKIMTLLRGCAGRGNLSREADQAVGTLAIDVGGTKFSMAVFEGERTAVRATRSTDREGGAMDAPSRSPLAREWGEAFSNRALRASAFGGPVEFHRQRWLVDARGGWLDFALPRGLNANCASPAIHGTMMRTSAPWAKPCYGAGVGIAFVST